MPAESDRAVFVISVAAELAGVHPQTLRIYEREGLVRPKRTTSNARRYSERDIQRLLEIKRLTGDGMNLEGVKRVIALTQEIERLQAEVAELQAQLRAQARRHRQELEKVRRSARRDLVPYSSAIVRYEHPSRYEQA
jgi:MerR family transcriptional regulator, heat shock protein HspR